MASESTSSVFPGIGENHWRTPSGGDPGASRALQEEILKHIRVVGDMIERVGEKLETGDFEKIGDAIYDLGNRLEQIKEGTEDEYPEEEYPIE